MGACRPRRWRTRQTRRERGRGRFRPHGAAAGSLNRVQGRRKWGVDHAACQQRERGCGAGCQMQCRGKS
eukprot:9690932-Lingulodinium_polyedra.AAC.1